MLCEEVTALLPGLVDGDIEADAETARHIETCLRCQAELARYRRLLRTLSLLRTRYAEPTPGLLGETLAALTDAAEESARRTRETFRAGTGTDVRKSLAARQLALP